MSKPDPNERLTPVGKPITRPEALAIATRILECAEQQRDETARREAGPDDTSRDAEIARLKAARKHDEATWHNMFAMGYKSLDVLGAAGMGAPGKSNCLIDMVEEAVAEIAHLKAEVEKLRDQVEFLRTMKCGKCGRLMPPDGDCYGCEVDRLKAGMPAPAPYSESNPPQMGDMVRVDGLIGVVFNPSVGGRPNVWTIRKAEHLGLNLTDVSELTLLYRPEATP